MLFKFLNRRIFLKYPAGLEKVKEWAGRILLIPAPGF